MEHKLFLVRHTFTDKSTIGSFYLNKPNGMQLQIDCLEDKDRGLKQSMPLSEIKAIKVDKQTCIPYGVYAIGKRLSKRFKKVLYAIYDVPGFEGILCHNGNYNTDTDGCLIIGIQDGITDMVSKSRVTLPRFEALIEKYQIKTIEIVKAGSF